MTAMQLDCELVTAVVTPFTREGEVDYPALEGLVHHLIDSGSDGILVAGSTGETPTLSEDEKLEMLKTVKSAIGSRPVKLIANAGTNDTRRSIEIAHKMSAIGPDALLMVTPYYNKPSQKCLLAHFGEVARQVERPCILYNIPGRSVVNIEPKTIVALAEKHSNIIGVKQSNPSMDELSEIRRLAPSGFTLWSGDDSLTLPMLSLGAQGLISVSSHIAGAPIREMIQAFKAGNTQRATELHVQLMPIFKGLFTMPNPTPVKACLSELGLVENVLRLPLLAAEGDELTPLKELVTLAKQFQPSQVSTQV